MTIFNSTKRALFFSVIAMFICIIMLLGATYAWFTDSATSPGNQITAGNLNVELYHWTSATESTNISDSATPVFSNSIKWEPGRTEVVYLSVKNAGDLNLKYKVDLVVTSISHDNLADVMEYAIATGAKYGDVTSWEGNGAKLVNAPGSNATDVVDVELAPGAENFYAISIHMSEEAGNQYMGETITFDIDVLAGQATVEEDGFGSDSYDEFAGYPGTAYAPKPATGEAAAILNITDKTGYKIGSAIVPTDAIADDATGVAANVVDSTYEANITVDTGITTKAFDVTIEGLKEGNTVPVKVELRIDAGLDPDTVKLYHYDTLIDSTYNPHTGYITFESATFSPFTVAYDADSEYVAPEISEDMDIPTATVTYLGVNAGEDTIDWESYGQWSPTEGLDSTLEASFKFACPTNLAEDVEAAYENWYCDFFVSLDKDLGANQIFLGGNYGSFGWVGFHNGDLTLAANYELPLLSSVTTNPWTYANVRDSVGEFICGVGDVADALEGATFTVKLRLINPEMVDTTVSEWWANLPAEAYADVNVVTYTFGGDYVIK